MAAAGFGVCYWKLVLPSKTEDPPGSKIVKLERGESIEAQGRLEPASGVLLIAALPGEEIVQLNAYGGKQVNQGDELAVLGSQEIRETELQLALEQEKTAVAQRKSQLALAELRKKAADISRQRAEAGENEIPPQELQQVAQDRRDAADTQLKTLRQLYADPATRDAITGAELKQQELLLQQLDAEIKHNNAKRAAAERTQELALEAARLDVEIAGESYRALEDANPEATLQLTAKLAGLAAKATKVLAPCNGTVLEVYARQGERVANTPLLQMADLNTMICVAEVHEARLHEIQSDVEQGSMKLIPVKDYPVTITSAAFDEQLKGEVIEVGRLIGAPALRNPNPLASTDRRTAKVKIRLDDDSMAKARRFVNLQVNVKIHLVSPEEIQRK